MEFIITDSRLITTIDENLLNDNHLGVFKKLKKDLRQVKKSLNTYSFVNDYEKEIFKLFFNDKKFEENPEFIKTLYIHAYHYGKLDKLDKAMEYLQLALKVNPISNDVLINLANINLELGENDKAFDYLKEALKYSYTITMLMNSYLLLQNYYEKLGNEEMVDLIEYLLDYYEKSVEYEGEMFDLAKTQNLQTEISPEISSKFKEIYEKTEDDEYGEILELMNRDIHAEKLNQLYESLLEE